MLICGIVLTVTTMLRMRSGRITLPSWGKTLLCIAMIAMLVIQIFAMLPPDIIQIDNPFEVEHFHTVYPVTPESIEAAP
jgi:hypothetical protein